MLTGKALGQAVKEAIRLKGVSKMAVARHFNIKGPSIYDWINHGRVGKQHLTDLFAYFSDVVGPEHWGISSPNQPSQLLELDADILASSIVSLKESAERSELQLDFFHAAEALAYVYEQRVKHPKKMTKAEYAVFDEEIRKKLSKGTANEEVGRREALGRTESVSKPAAETKKARSSGSGGKR